MKKCNYAPTRGPIAEAFILSALECKGSNVVDFATWKTKKLLTDNLVMPLQEKSLSGLDPLHAQYVAIQRQIMNFIAQFSVIPASHELNKNYDLAKNIYLRCGPPMSPLTANYFNCWALFDMCIGITRETYTTIMIECNKVFGTNLALTRLLEKMQQSRMGLYINEGNDKKFVYLRELCTNQISKVHMPCQYLGETCELWLTRLLPSPTPEYADYSISFIRPYTIVKLNSKENFGNYSAKPAYQEKEWIEFIERNVKRTKCKDFQKGYYLLMKYGLTQHYWSDYIFQSYVNYQSNAIWLTGFPDNPTLLTKAKTARPTRSKLKTQKTQKATP